MTIRWMDGPAIERSAVGKARFLLLEGETLASGLKRMLLAEIGDAHATLEQPDLSREEAIHRVRRRLKWVRSLWFVLAPVPGANREGRIALVRAVAQSLAEARDTDVITAEARRLVHHAEGRAVAATTLLIERIEAANRIARPLEPPFEQVAARLRAAEADARSLPERFEAGPLLAEALTEAYRRGRRDWREIGDGSSTAALHDWRKRVKRRRHLSALVPFDTAVTTASVQADLERLGEILGQENDLHLLEARLRAKPILLADVEGRDVVLDLVARQRRKAKKLAIDLGEELYGDRTRLFSAELKDLAEA